MKPKMLADLDRIAWKDLRHAYGSAKDVPGLLRALKTASPDLKNVDSPLWHLYGNIWHQGTVYEATAYAIPFLIEVAVDEETVDREGVLGLLATIAIGFNVMKDEERSWVQLGKEGLSKGFSSLVKLIDQQSDLCLSAAHVLAQLPSHSVKVAKILSKMLKTEEQKMKRAGLVLLLGQTGDQSKQTISSLEDAVSQKEPLQKLAAAIAMAQLRLRPLPPEAHQIIMKEYVAKDYDSCFAELPWDVPGEISDDDLLACLSASDRENIADRLIARIETSKATTQEVDVLVNLLFPTSSTGRTPMRKPADLSERQQRAVCAMYEAMKGGERLFYGHFPCWGLPDSLKDWRALALGETGRRNKP